MSVSTRAVVPALLAFGLTSCGTAMPGFEPFSPARRPTAEFANIAYADWTEAEPVGSSRVDLQACKLEYSIVSPK